ncbi:MAG: ABC transporter ATP-binding protein [Candidatus Latescibacter sp.]|nr:ABC transporter ATP-binding protein [Candidatus Latescibacter sp.]
MTQESISIRNYSFSIGDKRILFDVSLSVKEGEFLSVIGPNGAGKSTLIKCLIRINTGGKGEISLAGKPLELYSQKALARLLGYVPQTDGRSLPFTVEEFVMMGRYPYLSPFTPISHKDEQAVQDALDITGTGRLAERVMNTLSGGERQNVLIAAALAQGARILLLDEPTTFLDPKHVADVHRILKRTNRERGFTIVMVTHDINAAALLSDRIAILKEGRMAFEGLPGEVMQNDILSRIYDKPFLFVTHPVTGQQFIVHEEP